MNRRPLEEQYKDHTNELKRQLENAKRQVERIPYLEEVSQLSFEDWCYWMGCTTNSLKKKNQYNENKNN